MIIDDNGARRLIASILKKACEDYTSDKLCPEWCSFKDTCELKQVDDEHCDANALFILPGVRRFVIVWTLIMKSMFQFALKSIG